ncbi:MAG: isoprenylcysteine carboxylmethyltransferase family protein [Acidobacteriota bacterium]
MQNLNAEAWLRLGFLAIVMGLALFVTAGTRHYWQAWVYLSTFFGSSILITLYLMKHDPALLKRRMSAGPTAEKESPQAIIMFVASIAFIALLVVPALDRRFLWSSVPLWAVVAGDMLTALCFYIAFVVFEENTFSSATIEIVEDQEVISTGLYSLVRHPMYAGALLLAIGTPLALGSYWGFLASAMLLSAGAWRLFDEEAFLSKNLPGYTDYCARVRWRLIPGIF